MITLIFRFSVLALSGLFFSSCGSSSQPAPVRPDPSTYSTAVLAQRVLANPRITLLKKQVSGRVDGASAYHNIASMARGYSAKRSSYGNAPGGYVNLRKQMLETMLYLANTKGYTYNVTSIAGGSHSRTSRHYAGIAFDTSIINGRQVNYSNPYYRAFMRDGRLCGATEVLGPGDRAHSTHTHLAWPR